MVGPDVELQTKEKKSKSSKHFSNGKKLFLNCCVVMRNGTTMLLNGCTKLVVRSVGFDVACVWVGISEYHFPCNHCLDCFEGKELCFVPTLTTFLIEF
jgi:hypothetical protein